jgi:uncharacterized protein
MVIAPSSTQERDNINGNLLLIKSFSEKHHLYNDLHGWGHTLRVLENARRISRVEGGHWDLIEAMTWLHDIGRKYEDPQKQDHAELSAEIAEPFLRTLNLSPPIISEIIDGIKVHSFSRGKKTEMLEAQILSDADKLDALGAVGIFRASAYQYQHKQGLQEVLRHFEEKLLILDQKMYLHTSKRIAAERIERLKQYRSQLLDELNQETH